MSRSNASAPARKYWFTAEEADALEDCTFLTNFEALCIALGVDRDHMHVQEDGEGTYELCLGMVEGGGSFGDRTLRTFDTEEEAEEWLNAAPPAAPQSVPTGTYSMARKRARGE